jgi:hypothetical protein
MQLLGAYVDTLRLASRPSMPLPPGWAPPPTNATQRSRGGRRGPFDRTVMAHLINGREGDATERETQQRDTGEVGRFRPSGKV